MNSRSVYGAVRLFAILTMLAGVSLAAVSPARAEDPPPLPVTHQQFNFYQGPLTQSADGTVGESQYKNPSSPICDTSSSDSNVNTDCEGNAPHNETSIAVDPNNPQHMIASANDYQLRLSPGGTVNETTYSRVRVTDDGGQTWTTYPVYYRGYTSTGDPAVAFDVSGRAYIATLGFTWSQGAGSVINPDILVASSDDGGRTWSKPVRVAQGTGVFNSPGVLNDKEYLTAWGDGNAIVTWTVFNLGIGGSYRSSPIYASVTHNGGKSWSAPSRISGSASFCVGTGGGNACNQDQGSIPVVTADGSAIYVAFLNYSNGSQGRDQYVVVKLDPDSGHLVAGPYLVGTVFDGYRDYPISIDGRQTYQDSQFRTWALGNIAADPTNASHLALVWSDMRNSSLPAPRNPYAATTNSDVIVSQSYDGGETWSAPAALARSNDQFMPWGAYDGSGTLRIGFFDRYYDSANHAYGYTLATETAPGSLTFGYAQQSTALSDPTRDNRWFAGRTPNSDFPNPTTFLGDYSNIATNGGTVFSFWTDLRNDATFGSRTGAGQNAYYASAP
jgi:hypothetical protein